MKLSQAEAQKLYAHLNLSAQAIGYIEGVRSTEPARKVASADFHNVIYRYASRKMGCTIATESAQEHTFAALQEFDPDVLEYWDQPTSVPLQYVAKDGRSRRVSYTPDFLVLRKNTVEVMQVKPADVCKELVQERPGRWQQTESGYHDLAAEQYFSSFGLAHRVFVEAQQQKILAENARLLVNLRSQESAPPSPREVALVVEYLEGHGVATLDQIIGALKMENAVPLLQMIEAAVIHTALNRLRIAETRECIVGLNEKQVSTYLDDLADLQRTSASAPRFMSSAEVDATHSRWKQILGEAPCAMSRTTRWRLRRRLHASGGNPFSLLPQHWKKGNRRKQIDGHDLDTVRASVQKHFLSATAPTYSFAYDQYLLDHAEAKAQGMILNRPASINTFARICRTEDPAKIGRARGGRRLAYAMMNATDPNLRQLKALRAFERAHIDHQQLDRYVVVYGTGEDAQKEKPWITVMRDEFSGSIIAMAISIKSPSKFRCQAVLRDCARRHGRLPECLVSDNGGDFHSKYFEILLAQYGITKQTRPPDFARGSGEIESAFASLSSFIKFTAGGTFNDAKGRKTSTTHRGRATARFNLIETYHHVEDYFFKCFNVAPKAHLEAPATRLTSSLEKWPISGRATVLNADFLKATAVELDQKLKVHPSGVRHFGRWFTHPKLYSSSHKGYVTAYEEPWDQNRLYVLLDGERVTCTHAAGAQSDVPSLLASLEAILFNECQDTIALTRRAARLSNAKRYRESLKRTAAVVHRSRSQEKLYPPPSDFAVSPFKRR